MTTGTKTGPPPLDAETPSGAPEQSRARYPDSEGFVERDGQRLFYEVYGEGEETLFLLPTWSLIHSRHWKMQIPYFARHFRVLAMDGLGNGGSDRCRDPRRYDLAEFARDCLAVMDATGTERAVMVSLSTRRAVLSSSWRESPPSGWPAPSSSARYSPIPRRTGRCCCTRLSGALLPDRFAALALPLVGADERRPLARGLSRVRRVVHLPLLPRAALNQGDRGRGGMGA